MQVVPQVWERRAFELEIRTCVEARSSAHKESRIAMMVSLTHQLFVEAQQPCLRSSVPPFENYWLKPSVLGSPSVCMT